MAWNVCGIGMCMVWECTRPAGAHVLQEHMSCRSTRPGGAHVLEEHMSCRSTCPAGTHVLQKHMSCRSTCPGRAHVLEECVQRKRGLLTAKLGNGGSLPAVGSMQQARHSSTVGREGNSHQTLCTQKEGRVKVWQLHMPNLSPTTNLPWLRFQACFKVAPQVPLTTKLNVTEGFPLRKPSPKN